MEKYLLINVQYLKNGTQAQSIVDYVDEDDARSAYHSTLASNYADKTNLNGFTVILDNQIGGEILREYKEVPAAE